MRTPGEVAQAQLEAYNAHDPAALAACFTVDCEISDLFGAVTGRGREAVRARYEALFQQYPRNRAVVLHRIVVGATVIDHEDIDRAPGGERFEAVAIYRVTDGLISHMSLAR
ncbi:MAG: nuclear transport factor 2 family protein [Hyphomonadaceae bacterium]|nr:nuclear transport factor 2 family protein [Hyphomonadaceae bacterium]